MGEEEKKPEEPKPKPAEEKKKEEEAAPNPNPKPPEQDDKKPQEPKPADQPPQEIILRVYMHCEGCARKVRRCLKGFDGVEDVITDCKTSKVVVKGEKADPLKVLARIQRKSHRQVDLISPIPPPPPPEEAKKPDEKDPPKPPPPEPPVVTVILGVYMHCEACAQELKKRIQRMKGVESVVPELKSSQVTVKGVLDPEKLIEYVYKRTGKHATIIKVEPEKKEEEVKKEEKKPEEAAPKKEPKKGGEEGGKDTPKKEGEGGGGEAPPPAAKTEAAVETGDEETKVELKKNEMQYYYYPHYQQLQMQMHHQQQQQVYPQRFVQEYQHEYPSPQMFSDENPNACTVM